MSGKKKNGRPGIVGSVLTNKCPRCREGALFINPNPYVLRMTMHMPENCPVCGQKFELQTGFYFGTGYVSYGITIILSALTLVLWWFTIGIGIKDNRIWWWLLSNAALLVLLQPYLQRLARSIWIAIFVKYDKNRDREQLNA